MPMITGAGIVPITVEAYIQELNTRFQTALGSDLNLQSETPQGQLIGIFAALASSMDDGIRYVADGLDLNKATDNQLDVIGKQFGITRLTATQTTATVTIRGRTDATIGRPTLVSEDGFDFTITSLTEATIKAAGTDANIQSVSVGSIPLAVGDILTTPTNFDITQATVKRDSVVLGRDVETDAEYRSRIRFSVAYNSIGSLDGIRGNLRTLSIVKDARIFENDSNSIANFTSQTTGTVDFTTGLGGRIEGDVITLSTLQATINGASGVFSFTVNGIEIKNDTALGTNPTATDIQNAINEVLVANDDINASLDVLPTSRAVTHRGVVLGNTKVAFIMQGILSDNVTLGGTNAADIFGEDYITYNSIPAHTIVPVVNGGNKAQDIENIGNTIILSKPAGISTIGNITFNGEASSGLGATVNYYEAQEIAAKIVARIDPQPGYRTEQIAEIQRNIENYINGLSIGESIDESRILVEILRFGTIALAGGGSIEMTGTSRGAIYGSAVTTPNASEISDISINNDHSDPDNNPNIITATNKIAAGTNAEEIITALDMALDTALGENAEAAEVTYRGSGTKTYFEIRNLPSQFTTLSGDGVAAIFGNNPTIVHGFTGLRIVRANTEVHFNQKIVINDRNTDIDIKSAG